MENEQEVTPYRTDTRRKTRQSKNFREKNRKKREAGEAYKTIRKKKDIPKKDSTKESGNNNNNNKSCKVSSVA